MYHVEKTTWGCILLKFWFLKYQLLFSWFNESSHLDSILLQQRTLEYFKNIILISSPQVFHGGNNGSVDLLMSNWTWRCTSVISTNCGSNCNVFIEIICTMKRIFHIVCDNLISFLSRSCIWMSLGIIFIKKLRLDGLRYLSDNTTLRRKTGAVFSAQPQH